MKNNTNKKVGVKDIAKAAGVSIGTVDRVLHNRGEVKAETKDKIMAIVNELGYKPNVLARSLSTKKTTRIAIVIPDSSDNNPYWEKPVFGIKKAADELANFNIDIIYKYFDASLEQSYNEVLEKICQENINGIVLNPVFKELSMQYVNIFKAKNIPFAFIDINIKDIGQLGYFGQDAERSGLVSAKLMKQSTPPDSNILIVKQSKNRIFSEHIENRVKGFTEFYHNCSCAEKVTIKTIEIDLQNCEEPAYSLTNVFREQDKFDGIFVPNSRVFRVAEFLEADRNKNAVLIGYDLVDRNINYLKNDVIDYLISQKPEQQAYNAIMALFDHLISKKEVLKTSYSPIDIIIKENIDYYNINK